MTINTCSWPSGDPLMITFHDRELKKERIHFCGFNNLLRLHAGSGPGK